MRSLKVAQKATLPLIVEDDDATALTARIVVKQSADAASTVLDKIASFSDGQADLTLTPGETNIPEGDYVYELIIAYSDGLVNKYPDPAKCEDDCELPAFVVCPSLEGGVS